MADDLAVSYVSGFTKRGSMPPYATKVAKLTAGSSYPSGGYSAPTITDIRQVEGFIQTGANAGYVLKWDQDTRKFRVYRTGANDSSQVVSYAPGGGDIKGATNPVGESTEGNTDQNAAPVNSTLLMAAATITSLALTATPTVQPDVPRNVMITILNDSGGNLNLFEGVTTFTITGTDKDSAAQTETVTLTSTSGNKAVVTAKFRYVQGVKAFATVTTVTWDNAPAATLKLSLGIGTRIGLPAALDSGVLADVIDITVTAARIAPTTTDANSGGVDETNNCVNVGTIADGADVGIIFKRDYDPIAAAALAEVTTAASLSGVIFQGLIVGIP